MYPPPIAQKGSILPPQGALGVMIAYICTRCYGRFFSHRDIAAHMWTCTICPFRHWTLPILEVIPTFFPWKSMSHPWGAHSGDILNKSQYQKFLRLLLLGVKYLYNDVLKISSVIERIVSCPTMLVTSVKWFFNKRKSPCSSKRVGFEDSFNEMHELLWSLLD